MVSTPNAPGGLFHQLEQEPLETCIYKKIFLDYTYGLGTIQRKKSKRRSVLQVYQENMNYST
jgi:hypothetical protein